MGLDDFASGGTKTQSSKNSSSTSSSDSDDETQTNKVDPEDYFKVVSAGDGRKKVFETEEDWEETKEFIEVEMSMSMGEVLNMTPDKRHQILHKAILGDAGVEIDSFYQKRDCIVCGETFVFPHNWNFDKFKGEPVCLSHTLEEVHEAYEEINELD